ncbi:MAG: LVIVD repeat-containing protein [Halopenitus sp.]
MGNDNTANDTASDNTDVDNADIGSTDVDNADIDNTDVDNADIDNTDVDNADVDSDGSSTATSRRAVVRALGTGASVAAVTGTASAHTFGSTSGSTDSGHDHSDGSLHGSTSDVELLEYHSLGDLGPSSESSASDPHYGGIDEVRVRGDYAYVGFFTSKDPTNNRGLGVVDISEFNAADSTSELRDAEMDFQSFVRNDNDAASVMDVKVSADGDYVFFTKQPISLLFDDPDPTPSDDGSSTDTLTGAVTAVDVTNKSDPTVVGTYPHDTGFHNCFHHTIDGQDYVFVIKDIDDGTSGLYVFTFDRAAGALTLVNTWNRDGNLLDANVTGGATYIHDIVVQDDARLDKPVGYLSYWNAGLYALDLSDPTDISPIGHFDMSNCHYSEPAPTYIDGKRVVIAGQEIPSQSDGTTGKLYLLDADGIDGTWDGEDNMVELDSWEWRSNETFDDYTFSPHNFTVTDDGWVHVGHYHGGTRFLRLDSDDWTLTEKGYFRAAKDVPEDSKVVGLNHAAPFAWTAVRQQGVTYVADINTGLYALRYKPDSTSASVGTALGLGLLGALGKRYGVLDGLLGDSE